MSERNRQPGWYEKEACGTRFQVYGIGSVVCDLTSDAPDLIITPTANASFKLGVYMKHGDGKRLSSRLSEQTLLDLAETEASDFLRVDPDRERQLGVIGCGSGAQTVLMIPAVHER